MQTKKNLLRHTSQKHANKIESDKTNNESELYQCDGCHKAFQTKRKLSDHKRYHNTTQHNKKVSETKFVCKECHAEFLNKNNLHSHNRRVHIKPFSCKECDYRAAAAWILRNHKQYHHGEVQFNCDQCSFVVKGEFQLNAHIKRVHSTDTYECDVCKRILSSKETLRRHKRTMHGGVRKTHKCDLCDYKAFELRYVKIHMMTVHERKQFHCSECKKIFYSPSSVRKHVKREHSGEVLYCDKCGFSTYEKWRLKSHMAKHDGIYLKCEECEYKIGLLLCHSHIELRLWLRLS